MTQFVPPSIPPPNQDSEDLTDHEVSEAIITGDEKEFHNLLFTELRPGVASMGKGDARYALHRTELRRRGDDLYWRVYLGCPGEPDKILVYQVNWLGKSLPLKGV